MEIRIRQGRGGRWRWLWYDNAKMVRDPDSGVVSEVWEFVAVSSIRGYATESECESAAMRHFGAGVQMLKKGGTPDEDTVLYAGPRDWAD